MALLHTVADSSVRGFSALAGLTGVEAAQPGQSVGVPVLDLILKIVVVAASVGKPIVEAVRAIKSLFKKKK